MKMLIAGALSTLAVLVGTSRGLAIADFEPGAGPAGGWGAITGTVNAAGLDGNGNVVLITKKLVWVDDNQTTLIATHVRTKATTKLSHNHKESDFSVNQRTQANDYWNWFFDTTGDKATKTTDATNTTNCYCTALGSIANGTYAYWINTTQADTAFTDDTTSVAKAMVVGGDLLFYKSQTHASIVKSKTTDELGTITFRLRWKNNASGIYECDASTLDTPGMTNVMLTLNNPPSGTWGAIGSEGKLDPANNVRHKK